MKGINQYRVVLVLMMSLVSSMIFCQYSLEGYILDQTNNQPVITANIILSENSRGISTNVHGYFKIDNIKEEILTMSVSHIAYHDTLFKLKLPLDSTLNVFLVPDSVNISSIIVTATRYKSKVENIPQRVNVISSEKISSFPTNNTDDLLKMVPGLVVNRSWGIFSRNASVTMRGMPGSSRSLILLDGVPLNKTAGGTVNWHLVTPDEIEKIEVVKGPGSALYGMNAMGGVINIITKGADDKINGVVDFGYGSYNTFKSMINLRGNDMRDSKGLYWKIGGFYRQGDGYILETEEERSEYSSEAYLNEGNASALLGYQFNSKSKLEMDYRFYQDKRGSGIKVFEEDGSYESFTNNNFRVSYHNMLGRGQLTVNGFYFKEDYYRQKESVNSSSEYRLVDTETAKEDMGLWMSYSMPVKRFHRFSAGLDIKNGNLDNQEIYRTSTDEIYTNGDLIFTGIFAQDEINLVKEKLKIIAGLRMDYANFYDGQLRVVNPTDRTGFDSTFTESFPESSWIKLSPKISLKYFFNPALNVYTSFSTGFMPPKLDDLAGSKKIRKGFKKANPELIPEVIASIEAGFDWNIKNKFIIKPTGFYSIGNDFLYLVATGEILDEDSDDPVIVYQRQNVSKVEVAGAELGLSYIIRDGLEISGSYAYNYSNILEYSSPDGTDITGKELNEVPANLIFAGINWKNKYFDFSINYTFTDDQWFDEENTEIIESYSLLNLRISRRFIKHFQVSLDIQDLLDSRFVDRKGYLSPGRFIMLELKYFINKN